MPNLTNFGEKMASQCSSSSLWMLRHISFDKIRNKMASFMTYYLEWCWKSFLFFLLVVLILNDTICQPGQFSYFYLNFGPLSASVSYKTLSYKTLSYKKKWVYAIKTIKSLQMVIAASSTDENFRTCPFINI